MCGYGGMPNEADLGPWRKEPRTQIVIRPFASEDESGIGIVQLARDREHLRFRELIPVEDDTGGIPCEAFAGERIDLVDLDLARHRFVARS